MRPIAFVVIIIEAGKTKAPTTDARTLSRTYDNVPFHRSYICAFYLFNETHAKEGTEATTSKIKRERPFG